MWEELRRELRDWADAAGLSEPRQSVADLLIDIHIATRGKRTIVTIKALREKEDQSRAHDLAAVKVLEPVS